MGFAASLLVQPWARRILFYLSVIAAVVLVWIRMEQKSRKVGELAAKLDAEHAAVKAERIMLNEVGRSNTAASRAAVNAAASPDGMPEHDPFRRD